MTEWQPIETAPINETVHWWIRGLEGDGWLKTGHTPDSREPLRIISDDGHLYWPHENGGYPTHWMPLPQPPEQDQSAEGEALFNEYSALEEVNQRLWVRVQSLQRNISVDQVYEMMFAHLHAQIAQFRTDRSEKS